MGLGDSSADPLQGVVNTPMDPFEQLDESATPEAMRAERVAYRTLRTSGLKPFVTPRGKDVGFPDFAFTINVDGKVVDLHFEFKMNRLAQMGSLTRWTFNGTKFLGAVGDNDSAGMLLELMNGSDVCIASAKRVLKRLSKAFDTEFDTLSSGMLKAFNGHERRQGLLKLYKEAEGFTLANIADVSLGQMMLNHYYNKFKPRPKADVSVLLFMVGDTIGYIAADGDYTPAIQKAVAQALGVSRVPLIKPPVVTLEVRVQPKHMGEYRELIADHGKKIVDSELKKGDYALEPPVMMMMASYRMKGYDQGSQRS
jgi:hypothetical protein